MQNLYRVEALPPTIVIGVQTEEGVSAIDFDCSAWLERWPDMTLSAVHTRPGEMVSYPVETETHGPVLRWMVSQVDTEIAGQGVIEIIGLAAGKRKLSGKTCTHIEETSTTETTEPPEAMQPYIRRVQEAAEQAEEAAEDAKTAAGRAEAAAARAENAAENSSGSSGSTTTEETVPSYWLTHLQERIPTIRAAMAAAGWEKSAFLWYHDVHWTYGYKKAPMLLRYLYRHTPINKTIFGGDIVDNEGDDTTMAYLWDWRAAVRDLPNHHSVPGNHDDGNSTDNLWDDPYIYAYLLAAEETPDVVRGDSGLYYYIDDQVEKTRYLYLDTATADGNIINAAAEQAWLKETLISTPAGWHIVAIGHIWRTVDYDTTPPTDAGWSYGGSHCLEQLDAYNARSGDYVDCTGKVEFAIGGHTHVDATFFSDGGIPVILTECDARYVRSGLTCTEGTITEASVNAIVADYAAEKISVIRIGRGKSRTVYYDGTVEWETEETEEPEEELPDIPTGDFTNVLATVGYSEGMRYSTSAASDVAATGWDLTGYISATKGNTIYLANVTWYPSEENGGRGSLYWFDGDKGFISNNTILTADNLVNWSPVYDDAGNIVQITVPDAVGSSTAYIRICCQDITAASVITVNEPIYDDGTGDTGSDDSGSTETPVIPEGDFVNTLTEAGYTEGMRYSSDTGGGTDVEAVNWDITGYIAAKRGDTVYMANVTFFDLDGGGGATSRAMVYSFDADKAYITCSDGYSPDNLMSAAWNAVYGENGDLIQFTVPTAYSSSVAYIRIGARDISQYSVITVNEPIE